MMLSAKRSVMIFFSWFWFTFPSLSFYQWDIIMTIFSIIRHTSDSFFCSENAKIFLSLHEKNQSKFFYLIVIITNWPVIDLVMSTLCWMSSSLLTLITWLNVHSVGLNVFVTLTRLSQVFRRWSKPQHWSFIPFRSQVTKINVSVWWPWCWRTCPFLSLLLHVLYVIVNTSALQHVPSNLYFPTGTTVTLASTRIHLV